MLFDSTRFGLFFGVFFVVYHLAHRSFRVQNVIAVVGSFIFYGAWDVRFLGLLVLSAGIDYVTGLALARTPKELVRRRRRLLAVSLTANLLILFTFKYFDFFADSTKLLLSELHVETSLPLLHVALPVGISFYTFQSMSYCIDVYRGETEAERNIITYFAFVSFFPHMVAGPIQRAHHLLTQLNRPRVVRLDRAREAVWLLSYGYFLKCLIANGAAAFANVAFVESQKSGCTTLLGTMAFSLQIYCDFWAYSMIARGLGLLLGIEFIWNFRQPYFATSLQDFWQRWHISLSLWLRDYLYIPLGGNRKGSTRTYINLGLTMFLGGLWHGAAWNFVFWGLLHGVALSIERAFVGRTGAKKIPPLLGWILTMSVVGAGWFLFRCHSWAMIRGMVGSLTNLTWTHSHTRMLGGVALLAAPVALVEIYQYKKADLLAPLSWRPVAFGMLTGAFVFLAFLAFNRWQYAFIYFQF